MTHKYKTQKEKNEQISALWIYLDMSNISISGVYHFFVVNAVWKHVWLRRCVKVRKYKFCDIETSLGRLQSLIEY